MALIDYLEWLCSSEQKNKKEIQHLFDLFDCLRQDDLSKPSRQFDKSMTKRVGEILHARKMRETRDKVHTAVNKSVKRLPTEDGDKQAEINLREELSRLAQEFAMGEKEEDQDLQLETDREAIKKLREKLEKNLQKTNSEIERRTLQTTSLRATFKSPTVKKDPKNERQEKRALDLEADKGIDAIKKHREELEKNLQEANAAREQSILRLTNLRRALKSPTVEKDPKTERQEKFALGVETAKLFLAEKKIEELTKQVESLTD